jgi:hypothetical protein
MLQIWFELSHPSIVGILRCMCTHPIDLMGIHLLHCVHGNERTWTQDAIHNTFAPITRGVMNCILGCWLPRGLKTTTCASFKHVQFLSLTNWHYAHQKWHSHLNWHCHYQSNTSIFTSQILHHPRICYFQCDSSQKTKLLRLTPRRSIPPLSSGGIWMFT